MVEPPSGTVTFVFTDIEGSTRRWEAAASSMSDELARHDAVVRDAIGARGGHVLKSMGDGFLAVFARAGDAAGAAVDAQLALHEQDSLAVRMGIHTGEAEERDGDYFGPTLNRGARLMAAAHGGQIVVSEATARLLVDALPKGVTLVDLGQHRLRDLAREERVFQIDAPGLPSGFGPLRSVESSRTNLPARMTSLVGREQALADVAAILGSGRMVTITGVGGVGKTRLALQVGSDLVSDHVDGVWLLELASVASTEDLLQTVAGTLEVSIRPGLTLETSILEAIRDKEMLLVLDNCEHLLDPVADLAEKVLRGCPRVRLLATSREGLGVGGEQIWPLRSLVVPSAGTRPAELVGAPAAQLFVERARAALPTFGLDAASAEAVGEICRRLDGIPLAIELAAARTAAMTPGEIAGHLDERFRLLTGGRRAAAERHQTLRAAVEWSYSLLTPVEQGLFDSLSVFAGSFDADAATAVAAADALDGWDVLDALASLVAKSMLTAEGGTTTRYRQLETLRQYGAEQRDASGATDRDRRRHAEHFAAFADATSTGLLGIDELVWAERLAADLDNVRAALAWALDGPEPTDRSLGLRLAAVCALEANSGRIPGAGAWAERVLPLTDRSSPAERAAIQVGAAWHALHRGDLVPARRLAEEATRADVPPDAPALPIAYLALGVIVLIGGEPQGAVETAREGRARLSADDAWGSVVLRTAAISFSLLAGDVDRDELADLVDAADRLGNPTMIVNAHFVATVATWRSDPQGAARALDECIALTEAGAAAPTLGHMLSIRSVLYAVVGDRDTAIEELQRALRFSHTKGDLPMLSCVFDYGLQALEALGEDDAATLLTGIALSPLMKLVANLPVAEAPNRDRAIETLRQRVGPTRFDLEVERAGELPLDEAVARCLALLDGLGEATA